MDASWHELIDKMRGAESRGEVPELVEVCACRDLRNESTPAKVLQPGLRMLLFKQKEPILRAIKINIKIKIKIKIKLKSINIEI